MDTKKLSEKYHGDMADTYDQLRRNTPQWESEQRIVESLLSRFPSGTSVLDVPVGTGRFLHAYAVSRFDATGVDVSTSMLAKAAEKADEGVTLREGSIVALKFPDRSFDLVVCLRFMDWVEGEFFEKAFAELARVAKTAIIVSIPTYTPIRKIGWHRLGGMMRLLRQWKLRFYQLRTRSDGVIHAERRVADLIGRLGLQVVERISIDTPSARPWLLGQDRDIYLLTKGGGPR